MDLLKNKKTDNENIKNNSYMQFNMGQLTQDTNIEGIKFDFNYGARVVVPKGDYRVKFIDKEACLGIYDAPASGVLVTSNKKYFVDFRIEIYEQDKLIFSHDLDLKDKNVLIKFPVGVLGDVISWIPYVELFRQKHKCKLYCAMDKELGEIFKRSYPEIIFIETDAKIENL